jgi:hypothetical protein
LTIISFEQAVIRTNEITERLKQEHEQALQNEADYYYTLAKQNSRYTSAVIVQDVFLEWLHYQWAYPMQFIPIDFKGTEFEDKGYNWGELQDKIVAIRNGQNVKKD